MGYVEVNLKIAEIKAFNEDVLMLVIEDSTYAQWVPIQLGTLHINRALNLISDKEITQLSTKGKCSKLASLLAGKMAKVWDVPEKTFFLDKLYCCLLSFITLDIRYTNVQSYGLGPIAWPNVPCFKLSTYYLIVDVDMCYGLTLCVRWGGRF